MTDLEKAYAIAAKLSHMSIEKGAWENMMPDKIYNIEVDDKTISIGPFTDEHSGWSEDMVWKIPNTIYGIAIASEKFDSWGTHYDNYGVEFHVVELEEVIVYKVKERHWNNPHTMPRFKVEW